jgi:replicative superfamily II helicase
MATLAKAVSYLTAKQGDTITYDQFAFGMGAKDRLTQAESLVWHEQYIKEDASAKREWLHEWQHNYLMGKLNISSKEADRILSQTRDERSRTNQLAYKAGTEQFRFHIVRPEPSTTVKQKKVTLAMVREMFGQLSKKDQAEFLRNPK